MKDFAPALFVTFATFDSVTYAQQVRGFGRHCPVCVLPHRHAQISSDIGTALLAALTPTRLKVPSP